MAYSCPYIARQYPLGAPGTATSESPVRLLSPIWILSACFTRITSNRLSLGLFGRMCPGLSLWPLFPSVGAWQELDALVVDSFWWQQAPKERR